jgi:hypothetical protein
VTAKAIKLPQATVLFTKSQRSLLRLFTHSITHSVSSGVDFLCDAAVGSEDSLPACVCVLAGLVPCFDLELSLVSHSILHAN